MLTCACRAGRRVGEAVRQGGPPVRIAAPRHWAGGDEAAGADGVVVGAGMSAAQIAGPAFTRDDRVRDALRNFNADDLDSLHPS